jgi:hypothetical protein
LASPKQLGILFDDKLKIGELNKENQNRAIRNRREILSYLAPENQV